MRVLDPIVCVLRRMLSGARAEFTQGCTVGAQPVGDDLLRPAVPTPQFPEELQCWLAIPGLRHHAFEHLALGIVGVPETVLNAVDLQEDLGKVLLSLQAGPHCRSTVPEDLGGEKGLNRCHRKRTASRLTSMPRLWSRSTTLRNECGNRT